MTTRFLIITVDWKFDAEQYWTSRPAAFDTLLGSVRRGVGQTSYPRYAARLGGMAINMGCCLLAVRDHLRIDATLERPGRDELTATPRRVVASPVNFLDFFVVGLAVACMGSSPCRSVAPLSAPSAEQSFRCSSGAAMQPMAGLFRIFPVQVERSEGQVLIFFVVAGFEVSLRTPVLPTLSSSSPDRRMRRERYKQLRYLNPV